MYRVSVSLDSNDRFEDDANGDSSFAIHGMITITNDNENDVEINDENTTNDIIPGYHDAKYEFLKLPHDKNGINRLDCLLIDGKLYYNGKFIISYDELKDHICQRDRHDGIAIYDYGCFFITDTPSLNSKDPNPDIYFNTLQIDNAIINDSWFCFTIYKQGYDEDCYQ